MNSNATFCVVTVSPACVCCCVVFMCVLLSMQYVTVSPCFWRERWDECVTQTLPWSERLGGLTCSLHISLTALDAMSTPIELTLWVYGKPVLSKIKLSTQNHHSPLLLSVCLNLHWYWLHRSQDFGLGYIEMPWACLSLYTHIQIRFQQGCLCKYMA